MPLAMDNLTYVYNTALDPVSGNPYLVNNRLTQVTDQVANGNYAEDIDGQSANNYHYDKIGNLVKDVKENIDRIEWTVYGKIKKITKGNGDIIAYTYDAAGNRASKSVTLGGVTTLTWYVRDAQGNSLALYSDKQGGQSGMWWKEQSLYGSSRLGVWAPEINISSVNGTSEWSVAGKTVYELSNHLGNVLATITDKKIGHDPGNGIIDYYNADVTSATDYYPFGMQMPGRNWSSSTYRYGFNGKENDNEVKGTGNQQDYGMRIYDPRIGRFLSVDPLAKKYADESPYIFSGNGPISIIDQDGREKIYYLTKIAKDGTTTQLKVIEKYTVQKRTTYERQSIGFGGVAIFTSPQIANTKAFDVAQHITLDERTGILTIEKEYTTTERSNSKTLRAIQDNAKELRNYLKEGSNGGGGIVFTSATGQGQETRSGYNADGQPENIDALTAVLGAASAAASSTQAKGFLETFKQSVDAMTLVKDVFDNSENLLYQGPEPTTTNKDSCTFCHETGPNLKTIEEGGKHAGPIIPAQSDKKKP